MNFKSQIFKRGLFSYAPFLLVLFGNLWIWRIFSTNILIGLTTVFSSLFLYQSVRSNKSKKLLVFFFLILLFFQYKNTRILPLTYLNEQEKVLQLRRLNEHPPVKLSLGSKSIWIPTAYWLEKRAEILIFYRMQKNLKEVLSPNLYFFANHPNERVGIKEYEKFPYILLPFFVVGLLGLNFRRNITFGILLFATIFLLAIIGSDGGAEPISIFPFIAIASVRGLEYVWGRISKLKSQNLRITTVSIFILIYLLIIVQTAYYNFS